MDAIDALGGSTTVPDESFELYWTGYIVQDLVEEADESKPRAITIKAADGISLLSTIDYNFSLASSKKNFKDIFVDILDLSNISDLFEADEVMVTNVVKWYAEEHTAGLTTDPMTITRIDLKAFTQYTPGGVRVYTNALEVIREIAVIMGARFYFDAGSFRFEQGLTFTDYVELAAGLTDRARKKDIYVIEPNGAVVPLQGSKRQLFRFDRTVAGLSPGSVVVVPTNYDYEKPLDRYRGITSVVFESVASIAAFFSIANK